MKKTILLTIACLVMALSCACASASAEMIEGGEAKAIYGKAPAAAVDEVISEYNSCRAATSAPAETDDVYAPLTVAQRAYNEGNCYIVYPEVQGISTADAINASIRAEVVARAAHFDTQVFTEYRVEYNRNGIFSIRIFLYDLYGDNEQYLDCLPLTYNAETGELCTISCFFNCEDDRWRGRIPDMITTQANDSEMLLLNDITPIDDDQQFYITDDAVVIVYDLYEISVYSAGSPEFEIPVDELAEYINGASMLNVFLAPSEEGAVAVEVQEPIAATEIETGTEPVLAAAVAEPPIETAEAEVRPNEESPAEEVQ